MTITLRRESLASRPASAELCAEIAGVLAQGGLVALGTETVYGLAARADVPSALERLDALKGREARRALTWHVASRAALELFEELPHTLERLAGRYWPGPLTLVLRGSPNGLAAVAHEGWTGVRCPAHTATRSILERLPFPVVMSSANRTGQAPCTEAAAVIELFEGRLEIVVDSGPARIGESSTVLAIGRGRFEILREGLISAEDLRRSAGLDVGFICTGNTCRSPMAEHLARQGLASRLDVAPAAVGDFGFHLVSAGLMAGTGTPASAQAVELLSASGIDLSGHRSRPATAELVAGLDRVYCLTSTHRDTLRSLLPPDRSAIVELLDPGGADVPDPIGGTLEDYSRCAELIRTALEARYDEWL